MLWMALGLVSAIAALLRPSVRDPTKPETVHPQCLFPARYAWIKQQLGSAAFVDQPCPLLDTWRTGISAEAATLVYATAYLNSPASMYGTVPRRNASRPSNCRASCRKVTPSARVVARQAATGAAVGPYHVHVSAYDHGDARRHTPRAARRAGSSTRPGGRPGSLCPAAARFPRSAAGL